MGMENEWSIPQLPAENVDTLIDRDGREYVRVGGEGEYWYSGALGPGRGTYHWVDLLQQRGPVRAL